MVYHLYHHFTDKTVDLTVCCRNASSLFDKVIDNSTVVVREAGLGGDIGNVNGIEKRIREAEKLGLSQILIPSGNFKESKQKYIISIKPIDDHLSAIELLIN